jgi:hypothetical protein
VTDITYKNYLLIPLQGGLHRKDTLFERDEMKLVFVKGLLQKAPQTQAQTFASGAKGEA